jgi:hypothetical protein
VQSLPADHPFRLHSENLRAARDGLTQAERVHKAAIRRKNDAEIEFAARTHQLLVGIAAEAYLRKIIADPGGFNDNERALLARARSQSERWTMTVEFAFRRHYKVLLHQRVDEGSLPVAIAQQFSSLGHMIETDLDPVIGDRNKIAHAQWRWLLNSKEERFTGAAPAPLNYMQSHRRSQIIDDLAKLVYVLAVSEPTFQRDYDHYFASIADLREGLDGAGYEDFARSLRRPKGR